MPFSDPSERRGLDRRQLLTAGVWAAPAVVLATATPAHAASTVLSRQAVRIPQAPSVGTNGVAGAVVVHHASVNYDYNAWGLTGQHNQTAGPQSASVSWRVVLKNSSGTTVGTFTSRTDVIAKYGTASVSGAWLTGLAAGAYTVVTEIVSVTFSPNPIDGVTFVSPAASASSTITVT